MNSNGIMVGGGGNPPILNFSLSSSWKILFQKYKIWD